MRIKQRRNGELDAEKNDKGMWIINTTVPQEVYDAKMQAIELEKRADSLYKEYFRLGKEYVKTKQTITKLTRIVNDFVNDYKMHEIEKLFEEETND